MAIACLHTVESNVAVFERAAASVGVTLRHEVRTDFLREEEAAGELTDAIAERVAEVARELARSADAVLLTCSTIGPAVERVGEASAPVMRVDGALAEAAVSAGGLVIVLGAAATTIGPTQTLFERARGDGEAEIEMRLVPGAWDAFKAGDVGRYHALIAAAADQAFRDGARVVALAQASMSDAAALCREGVPMTSPTAGLAAAAAAAARRDIFPPALRLYVEGLKTHDLEKIAASVDDALAFVTPVRVMDKAQFLTFIGALYSGFPDWAYDHDPPVAREDGAIGIWWRQGGTHSAPLALPGFPEVAPTGRKVTIPEHFFFYRVADGKIREIRPDPVPGGAPRGIFEQIGVALPPL